MRSSNNNFWIRYHSHPVKFQVITRYACESSSSPALADTNDNFLFWWKGFHVFPLEVPHFIPQGGISFGMTPLIFWGGVRRGLRPCLTPLTTNALSFRSAKGEESIPELFR